MPARRSSGCGRLTPRDVGASVNLGQIHLEERRYDAGDRGCCGPAVAAEPYNVTAAYNLGLALTRGGQRDEGQRILERAQTLRTAGYAVTYGTGYLEQGRYAEAIASTGAEAGLVDDGRPPATFTPGARSARRPAGRRCCRLAVRPPLRRCRSRRRGGRRALAAGLGGGVDARSTSTSDGDLDLFVASVDGQRLLRNDGRGVWTDVTAASGLEAAPPRSVPIGCVAGDYDNDGHDDLFVLRVRRQRAVSQRRQRPLQRRDGAAGLPPYPFLPGAAAFVDVDHDGDLDLVIAGLADVAATRRARRRAPDPFPRDSSPAPLQLLRNNGNGTFTDITADARLRPPRRTPSPSCRPISTTAATSICSSSIATRRRCCSRTCATARFATSPPTSGLGGHGGAAARRSPASTAADVNKDEFPGFLLRRRERRRVRAERRPRPVHCRAGAGRCDEPRVAAQLVDYDNDGLLDLADVVGRRAARRPQPGPWMWRDVSALSTFDRRRHRADRRAVARRARLALADLERRRAAPIW